MGRGAPGFNPINCRFTIGMQSSIQLSIPRPCQQHGLWCQITCVQILVFSHHWFYDFYFPCSSGKKKIR